MTGGRRHDTATRGGQPMAARRLSTTTLTLTVVGMLAIGVFIVPQGLMFRSGATPAPTSVASASATEGTSIPTVGPTAQPSAGLTGEFPSADATVPPDAPSIIPDLRIEDLAAAASAEGLTCLSEAGTVQETHGGYTLGCEGEDRAGNAKLALIVTYWARDGVSEIYFSATSITAGAVVSPAVPIKLMSSISTLSSGDVARTWVLAQLDDDDRCRRGCVRTEGRVRLEAQTGSYGSRALYVTAVGG